MEPRMSDKLAISSALSVLMMASYVLFGGHARHVDLRAPDVRLEAFAPAGLPEVAELTRR
jgi:hypothetical protein